ncbi:Crp/Fnr family transcriptional regulator [Flavobacteriaceae bacterium S356]|uniref:Crp/Fnr family transcriptional regulator n=1 Tax=Asprobacillus argus TaxID=3076534 RepID=A0ABU3LJB9_9FLAO|nr:Crp/Fnr family transcriptional regulator [Flavobacteriaceae bacterium S356]
MSALESLLKALEDHWSHTIELKRNEFLVKKGTVHTNLYWIEEGSVRVFIEDEIEEHTIRFGYQNSIMGALDSFLNDEPTIFYIQALKKCTLRVISKEDYLAFINSKEAYQDIWQKMLEDFVIQQIEREVDLITYSPQKRFERVFKRSPQLFQEIPQKYIASYLRMTPETLSRILKNLD